MGYQGEGNLLFIYYFLSVVDNNQTTIVNIISIGYDFLQLFFLSYFKQQETIKTGNEVLIENYSISFPSLS